MRSPRPLIPRKTRARARCADDDMLNYSRRLRHTRLAAVVVPPSSSFLLSLLPGPRSQLSLGSSRKIQKSKLC